MKLGENLFHLRKKNHLSQEELAEKLKTKFATIICNTIEDEPYVENESFLSIQYTNILFKKRQICC